MKIRLIPNLRQSLAPLFQEIYRRQVKSMRKESFYNGNRMTVTLEMMMDTIDSLEAFEKRFPSEFLANDDHVGEYLQSLLWKYDQKASVVSTNAMLAASYVGNIINGKKRNPSRDALISICFAIGTTEGSIYAPELKSCMMGLLESLAYLLEVPAIDIKRLVCFPYRCV